jgi:ABC-type lipoprotein release transport system permease subunit
MASDVSDSLETDEEGEPIFSKEVYHFLNVYVVDDPEEKPRRALVHGMKPDYARRLLPGFRLIEGRLPDPGLNELMVGRSVARKLRVPEGLLRPPRPGVDGGAVQVRDTLYDVVGVFEAPGTLYENWMLTDTSDLQVTLGRRDYSFARMRVRPGVDQAALARRLSLDERYQVNVLSEEEYFADFAEGFTHFRQFSVMLALILGLGGVLAGMNTLHNAVVGRVREIGTLRVLGFGKGKILLAFLLEALLLTGMAGLLGCGIGFLANGLPMRVPLAATFPVTVDGTALAVGFLTALLMGVLGLSFPLYKALKLPAVEAVRAV